MRGAKPSQSRNIPTAGFRFDAVDHRYFALDTGEELPHITGMLARTGHVDDRWFTEESCERGIKVHALTALYDLNALTAEAYDGPYRPYLLAHMRAMQILQPIMLAVEEPRMHTRYRFAGRPDRKVRLDRMAGVLEIKTGATQHTDGLQTALQAILIADQGALPPETLGRWVLYLRSTGRFRFMKFENRADFLEARRIIKQCC